MHDPVPAGAQAPPRPGGGVTGTARGRRSRAAFWRAFAIWALTIGVTSVSLVYEHAHPVPASLASRGSVADGVAGLAFIAGFATVGALLGWKRPANPVGWLLAATGASYGIGALAGLLGNFRPTLALSGWLAWSWLFGLG